MMEILKEKITRAKLKALAQEMFGHLVKAAADIEKGTMAINGELHSDLAELLVENGSRGQDVWGFNIYPELDSSEWIEFDSMVNLKPFLNNRTRYVENSEIREKILTIVNNFIEK